MPDTQPKTLRQALYHYAVFGLVICLFLATIWLLIWFDYSKHGTRTERGFLQPYASTVLTWIGGLSVVLIVVAKLTHTPMTQKERNALHAKARRTAGGAEYDALRERIANRFPDELADKTPPVTLTKLYDAAIDDSLRSWIGGPAPRLAAPWPLHPVTSQPLRHMLTVSLTELAPSMRSDILPPSGQLSFFASALDQMPETRNAWHSDGFAVVMTPFETAPQRKSGDLDLPMTPVAFSVPDVDPPTETPMEGSLRDSHQMFGEGLHIQDQLYAVHDREMLLQLGNDEDVDLRVSGVMQFMMYRDDIRAQAWDNAVVVMAFD